MKQYKTLVTQMAYSFSNWHLLENALCHRSVGVENNERLEFLGDAILGCIIAEILYRHYPQEKEGSLSRMRAFLVNRDILAEIGIELMLGDYLRLGPGESKSGGRERRSILADALEAVIGAIYLDSDFLTCYRCVSAWYGDRIKGLADLTAVKDAKSQLQEWLQAHKKPLPIYEAVISGEAHAQTFTVTCQVEGFPHRTTGISTNRRRAEQIAAQHYLDLLHE